MRVFVTVPVDVAEEDIEEAKEKAVEDVLELIDRGYDNWNYEELGNSPVVDFENVRVTDVDETHI